MVIVLDLRCSSVIGDDGAGLVADIVDHQQSCIAGVDEDGVAVFYKQGSILCNCVQVAVVVVVHVRHIDHALDQSCPAPGALNGAFAFPVLQVAADGDI